MSSVFVSIDTGGTRTRVEVATSADPPLSRGFEVSASLSGVVKPREYGNNLREIFAPIERYWHDNDVEDMPVYAFIAAAGFSALTRAAFQDAIHEALPEFCNGNVRAAGAANDASALLWGLNADGVVIAGTGSTAFVKTQDSTIHQAGGYEWVASDYGSGYWVGLTAIRQVAKDLEAGERSTLLNRFCEQYGLQEDDDAEVIARFRSLSYATPRMKADIARFASAVCAAAEGGDLDAQDIVKQEAEDFADSLARVVRRRFSRDDMEAGFSVVQCGSLLLSDFYKAAFEAQVQMRLGSGTDSMAIEWIQAKNGIEASMALARRLEGDVSDLMQVAPEYRPVIVRF